MNSNSMLVSKDGAVFFRDIKAFHIEKVDNYSYGVLAKLNDGTDIVLYKDSHIIDLPKELQNFATMLTQWHNTISKQVQKIIQEVIDP